MLRMRILEGEETMSLVDLSLKNWYDSAINVLYELRNTRKASTSLKCRIIMHYPNGQAETYHGYTDPGGQFLVAPVIMRAWLYPKPYWVDGIKTFYVSSNSGKVLDLESLGKVAEAVKSSAVVSWKHLRTWESMTVSELNTTLDMNLLDTTGTEYGSDFTTMTNTVKGSKMLEFLLDVPKRVYILSIIVAALFSAVLFTFATSVLWLIVVIMVRR